MNFHDHTKIIMCPLMSAVTYIDVDKNFRTYRFSTISKNGCNPGLLQCLDYACKKIESLLWRLMKLKSDGFVFILSLISDFFFLSFFFVFLMFCSHFRTIVIIVIISVEYFSVSVILFINLFEFYNGDCYALILLKWPKENVVDTLKLISK